MIRVIFCTFKHSLFYFRDIQESPVSVMIIPVLTTTTSCVEVSYNILAFANWKPLNGDFGKLQHFIRVCSVC